MKQLSFFGVDVGLCTIGDCIQPIRAKGKCSTHYNRASLGKDLYAPVKNFTRKRRYRRWDVPEGMGHCVDCDEVKTLTEFWRSQVSPNGRMHRCRQCSRYKLQNERYGHDERELLEVQRGICAICGLDDPVIGKGWHIDHDHETGAVRALLCSRCNTGLGYWANGDHMRAAALYLDAFA